MKIVILDRETLGIDTPFHEIERHGELVIYDSTPTEMIVERASKAEVVIINKVKLTADILKELPNLKLICVFATGYDNVDIKTAKECGIAVCNVPGYSTDSVAMFTVATVLALATNIREFSDFVSNGDYARSGRANCLVPVYHEIKGKTWGIIGFGNIGKAVGKIAEAFGANVIVNKKTPLESHTCVDIETLCRESDIITIHTPLNNETKHLINKNTISYMKKNVILVNEARGAVLNEEDVTEAIEKGAIAAFGCDVYSTEPFGTDHPYNRIMKKSNVLLTPHAAWGAYEARERCAYVIGQNIEAFKMDKLLNRVDI